MPYLIERFTHFECILTAKIKLAYDVWRMSVLILEHAKHYLVIVYIIHYLIQSKWSDIILFHKSSIPESENKSIKIISLSSLLFFKRIFFYGLWPIIEKKKIIPDRQFVFNYSTTNPLNNTPNICRFHRFQQKQWNQKI